MADRDEAFKNERARQSVDRNSVRVLRDGKLDPEESARIFANNLRADAVQSVDTAFNTRRNPESEPNQRRRIIQRAANAMAGAEGGMKSGGAVKKMASGGVVKSSAGRRADGCATRGKTKGRFV